MAARLRRSSIIAAVLLALIAGSSFFSVWAGEQNTLRLAVVQMAIAPELQTNCERMWQWVGKAAAQQARVVVFPEGALWAEPKDSDKLEHALQTLRIIAAEKNVY
ncbi:hypothetical protein, partial [Thermogutta sp.]|uniref:hypothetical protein n=1 Tax=Thermogutta sp. TaxID=1962930 RepID=UPI003C7CC556